MNQTHVKQCMIVALKSLKSSIILIPYILVFKEFLLWFLIWSPIWQLCEVGIYLLSSFTKKGTKAQRSWLLKGQKPANDKAKPLWSLDYFLRCHSWITCIRITNGIFITTDFKFLSSLSYRMRIFGSGVSIPHFIMDK